MSDLSEEAALQLQDDIDEVCDLIKEDMELDTEAAITVLFAALRDFVSDATGSEPVAMARLLRGMVDDMEDQIERGQLVPLDVYEGRVH